MINIITIATSWGSNYGGINTLNYELAKSFAKNDTIKVFCILPYTELVDERVQLISVYDKPTENFSEGWHLILQEKLQLQNISLNKIDFCIGHDVITGPEAILLKKKYKNLQLIVFSHQAYELYYVTKNNDGATALKKSQEQLNVYKEADILLCVGPLLFDHFKGKDQLFELRKDNRIHNFIPGLADVKISNAEPESFALMAMGRFEAENNDLKGVKTVVKSFSMALKESQQLFNNNPTLTLYGLTEDTTIRLKESMDIAEISKNISNGFLPINAAPYTTDRETLMNKVRDSSCVAMLSLNEGFGLVGWEAISCGVPLLLSQNTGLYRFLKLKNLDHLVSSVEITWTDKDLELVKEKLKDIAKNWENAKEEAAELLSKLKVEFTWDKVIVSLLTKIESGNSSPVLQSKIDNINEKNAQNSFQVVEQFYNLIQKKEFRKAWNLLTPNFKERGIWANFTEFERGYSNLAMLQNIKIYDSTIGFLVTEYNVFYDDVREVAQSPLLDDLRFHTIGMKEDFIKEIEKMEKKFLDMGIEKNKIDGLNLAHFFSPAIEDYLMFRLDIFDKIPKKSRKLQTIPRYYKCICVLNKGKWLIDRIIPIRYSD